MTGYGCGECVSKGAKIFVELSSVNRRQVEVALSLPSEIEALEPELRKILLASVSRGRVSGRVILERPAGKANRDIIINEAQATVYKTALRKLAGEIKINNDISLESLLRLPGVLETVDKRISSSSLLPALKKAFKQALSQLQLMRYKEGEYLRKDLTKRLAGLIALSKKISKQAPKVIVMHRKRLIERLAKADIQEQDINDERFLREVVYFTDRSDITEELTRLDSHFMQMQGCLRENEPVGRKLDFLAQEMFREINTIGSKANDSEIAKEVVAIKTELEKIREQVQNVE